MEKIKASIIVPTVQFGNITYEYEGLPSEINDFADYVLSLRAKHGEGLTEKEFAAFVDNQLLGNGKNHLDQYEKASAEQKVIIQCIKRSLKRIKANEQ